MSGYHKSKEVYKFHRNVHGEITLIPVRGLYVSGTHLEPAYYDHNITITSITSSDMTVVDYTSETDNVFDYSGIRLIDYDWSHTMTVTNYYSRTDNAYDYSGIRLIDYDWSYNMSITSYTSETEHMYDYSGIRLIDYDWSCTLSYFEPDPPTPKTEIGAYDHNITITEIVSGTGPNIT